MAPVKAPALPPVINDPTGELHGLPTYHWREAPKGLATRRQLAAMGLRPGGQQPVAQVRRRSRLVAYLYCIDQAKPQFTLTHAKLAAVWTAALSRYRCGSCGRRLSYIPRQAEPAFGRCWTCAGLPGGDDDGEPVCPCCHDAVTIKCPACSGRGDDCGFCHGQTLVACPACQPQFLR